MDLGLRGKVAIVCGSSRGLGRACAQALLAEGVDVVVNGRDTTALERAAVELRGFDGHVTPVRADVTTAEGRRLLHDACPEPDILVTNSAGPTPSDFLDATEDDWAASFKANMLAPILLVQAALPAMQRRKFGRIINITSAMVTTPRPAMGLSSGPRAGLTAVMKGLSLAVACDNVTINNLLPERFDTDRQRFMAEQEAARDDVSYLEARKRQRDSIAARRLGDPSEFGAFCAFLCGSHAGFVSGQNVHLDGGSYPALI